MPLQCKLLGLTLTLAALAAPTAALAAEGFARTSTTLRAGPSATYPRVSNVVRGEGLEVYGCLARATWCDVSDGEDRGWIQGNRIEFLRDGRRTRLSGDATVFGLAILSFGLSDYWGEHYQSRSWMHDRRWNPRDTMHAPIPPRSGSSFDAPRDPTPGADTGNRPVTARPSQLDPARAADPQSQKRDAPDSVTPPIRRLSPDAGNPTSRPEATRPQQTEPSRPSVAHQPPSGESGDAARPAPTLRKGTPSAGQTPPCTDPSGCR